LSCFFFKSETLIIFLGAITQEFFVRKDCMKGGVELKANTHLILTKPEGSKYDASLKWGIPCVSKEWLVESLTAGKKLEESDFSLDAHHTTITANNTSMKRVENNNNSIIPQQNDANLVSFDFSKRGASIMEGLDKVTRPNIAVDDTQDAPCQISTVVAACVTTTNGGNADPETTNSTTLHEISSGKRVEKDFSSFNTMISQQGKEEEDNEMQIQTNRENSEIEQQQPYIQAHNGFDSPKFAFDKSRLSFDFGEALEGIPSPVDLRRKSRRKSRASLPFDVQVTEALQKAVNRHVPEDEERLALDKSFDQKV